MMSILKSITNYRWQISDYVTIFLLSIVLFLILWGSMDLPYHWNWSTTLGYLYYVDEQTGNYHFGILLIGLFNTFRLFLLSIIIGMLLGMGLAFMRISRHVGLNFLGVVYINFVRNVPPLVFLFVFYFFISEQIFPKLGLTPELMESFPFLTWLFGEGVFGINLISGGICLGLFEAAFFAEILRGCIKSIPMGQMEASRALGLNWFQSMRLVIMPQALLKSYPALAGQSIVALKNTSIASLISVKDLVFSGVEVVTSTRSIFEAWIVVAVIYFILCFSLTKFFARWEHKLNKIA